MNVSQPSGGTSVEEIAAPLGLDQHELQPYYGIYQRPEARLTHLPVGPPSSGSSWVLVCPSETAAEIYIGHDAEINGRTRSDYEARRLSLPDAFDEARNLPLPVVHSTGAVYSKIGGVAVFDIISSRFRVIEMLPI